MVTPLIQPRSLPAPFYHAENGEARVTGSRVLVDIVLYDYKQGRTPAEIVEDFPTLELAHVHALIADYLQRTDEYEIFLADCERRDAEIDEYLRRAYPQEGLREELLRRMAERNATVSGR